MDTYEKKYKDALDRAKAQWGSVNDETRSWLEGTFPELRESEDERIRKDLITYLKSVQGETLDLTISVPKWIAYLEKQKEIPTDAKSERVIKAARRVLNNWLDGTDCPDVSGDFAELEYAIREYDGEEKQNEREELDKSLEGEMEKFIETFGWGKTKHLAEKELISATARHFAEWGAEHAKK